MVRFRHGGEWWHLLKRTKKKGKKGDYSRPDEESPVELATGVEPATWALQMPCSAIEPRQRIARINGLPQFVAPSIVDRSYAKALLINLEKLVFS